MEEDDSGDVKILSVIPRCQTCSKHTKYIIKNKKTGEKRYLCKLCGEVQFLSYMNGEWEIISLE